MNAVDGISSRTSPVGVNFEMLSNCLVRQQSGRVTHVQADTEQTTGQISE